MAFVDQLHIGQLWENRTNLRRFEVIQVHRKDKLCEVLWLDIDHRGIMLFSIMRDHYRPLTMYV